MRSSVPRSRAASRSRSRTLSRRQCGSGSSAKRRADIVRPGHDQHVFPRRNPLDDRIKLAVKAAAVAVAGIGEHAEKVMRAQTWSCSQTFDLHIGVGGRQALTVEQPPRDHLRLNLRRALEDAEDTRIAQHAADRIFQREAVAAVNLHAGCPPPPTLRARPAVSPCPPRHRSAGPRPSPARNSGSAGARHASQPPSSPACWPRAERRSAACRTARARGNSGTRDRAHSAPRRLPAPPSGCARIRTWPMSCLKPCPSVSPRRLFADTANPSKEISYSFMPR